MRFSSDNTNWREWEPYQTTKDWSLTTGDGNKAVYVQYQDKAGFASEAYQANIVVDSRLPTGALLINAGNTTTTSPAVTLTLLAIDDTSGIFKMRFSNDLISWSDWEDYSSSKDWTLPEGEGSKTVSAQLQDKAGNISETYSDTITLEAPAATTPATPSTTTPTSETTPTSQTIVRGGGGVYVFTQPAGDKSSSAKKSEERSFKPELPPQETTPERTIWRPPSPEYPEARREPRYSSFESKARGVNFLGFNDKYGRIKEVLVLDAQGNVTSSYRVRYGLLRSSRVILLRQDKTKVYLYLNKKKQVKKYSIKRAKQAPPQVIQEEVRQVIEFMGYEVVEKGV
jgi:hypothetical protein